MSKLDAYPRVEVKSRAELRRFLARHHRAGGAFWLVTYKKGSAHHVSWTDAVEEALCVGFIDSLPRKLDAARTMLLLSPRKPTSAWSKRNRELVASLRARKLMRPAGEAAVARAQSNGRWEALAASDTLEVPPDLARALRAHAGAVAQFAAFPPSARRAILEWIHAAKTPETRSKRVDETASKAAVGVRANQWRQAKAAGAATAAKRARHR